MSPDLLRLDLFYGELTVHRGLVYARLPRPAGDGWSLAGTIRGPRCLYAQTLPAAARLVDQGPGPTLLAQAVLPDPTCWTPDLPAIYDVSVNLLRGSEVVATTRRELGLRRLGVRGRDLMLDGKRWVLRGVATTSTTARLPREWHEAPAAIVTAACITAGSSDELLAEASQWGALAVIDIDAPAEAAASYLRDLARWPAAAIAIVTRPLATDFTKSQHCPNLLLAARIGPGATADVPPWADLAVASADSADDFACLIQPLKLPVLAERRLVVPLPLDQARAACDVLQRDLAPIGQLAGYIV
jgi:hypothetical protein